MGEDTNFTRRDALKATGGLVGGLAVGNAVAGSAAAQGSYYRYDAVRVRLVDADARPPRFHTVERALYLTEPSLADCDADDACGLDVLDYSVADDDDDNGDDDSNGDDDNDDDASDDGNGDDDGNDSGDDRGCPGFASVTLFCNANSGSDAVVLYGLMPDVLSEYDDRGFDFVAGFEPAEATNVEDPETVSSPCPAASDDDGDDDNDDGDDDTGADDDSDDDSDDGDDTSGDDNGDDDGNDDDTGGDDDADDN